MSFVRSRNLTVENPVDERLARGIPRLKDGLNEKLERRAFFGLLLFVSFGFAFLPERSAAGVLAGAVISFLSFRELKKTLERFFLATLSGSQGGGRTLVVRHYLKLTLLFIVLAAVLKSGRVEMFGLAVGLFLVPATLIYTGLLLYIGNFGGKGK